MFLIAFETPFKEDFKRIYPQLPQQAGDFVF
jgi:hypothetical protein